MTPLDTAKQIAVRYIDYAPRSIGEVRRRLEKSQISPDVIEQVIADFERAGLLDDEKLSRDWVESRARRKGLGKTRLTSELMKKGISREVAIEAASVIDFEAEVEAAFGLAQRKITAETLNDPVARRRLAGYLARRGYNWEIIQQVFRKLFANDE